MFHVIVQQTVTYINDIQKILNKNIMLNVVFREANRGDKGQKAKLIMLDIKSM